jgi:4-amino-4-deoxy-L-arabinose transferase-like glycosyltransferase
VRWLTAIAAVGLAVRLGYVFGWQYGVPIGGDSFYYHNAANLLADGRGFIDPYDYHTRGWVEDSADHPPLYIVVLAAGSLLGLDGYLAHQILSCLIGTVTIVLVGVTGREVIGPRAGLLAAAVVAVYPNFWLNDGVVLSEGLAQTTTALTVLLAYRFWRRRTVRSAVWLGVGIALATLSRAEAVLLPVLLTLPLALVLRPVPVRRRLRLWFVSGVAAAAVLAPWVGYNLARFEQPVTVSGGFDITLLSANCDDTWYGVHRGFWSFNCVKGEPRVHRDRSTQGLIYRDKALAYIGDRLPELPALLLAREGRTWGWYRPDQTPLLDAIETRPVPAARVALAMLYGLEIAAVFGVLTLRRRRVTVVPCVALLVNVSISTAITFGQTRYRAAAEVALVLLAVAGIDGLLRHLADRRRARSAAAAAPDTVPAGVPA